MPTEGQSQKQLETVEIGLLTVEGPRDDVIESSRRNMLQLQNEAEKISLTKLRRHVESTHPCKKMPDGTVEQFSINENLGDLPVSKCCRKDTTEMAKQIGIGPALFLMSTKALSYFFLFLTILNIPIFIFFYSGNPNTAGSFDSIFATFSLGNVGSNS